MDFFQTRMGAKFFNSDVPKIGKNLENLSDAVNQLTARKKTVRRCFRF